MNWEFKFILRTSHFMFDLQINDFQFGVRTRDFKLFKEQEILSLLY